MDGAVKVCPLGCINPAREGSDTHWTKCSDCDPSVVDPRWTTEQVQERLAALDVSIPNLEAEIASEKIIAKAEKAAAKKLKEDAKAAERQEKERLKAVERQERDERKAVEKEAKAQAKADKEAEREARRG